MKSDRKTREAMEHSIGGDNCHERRLIQAAVRGRSRQPKHLMSELLINQPPLPDYDILSMVCHGQIIC